MHFCSILRPALLLLARLELIVHCRHADKLDSASGVGFRASLQPPRSRLPTRLFTVITSVHHASISTFAMNLHLVARFGSLSLTGDFFVWISSIISA